MLLSQAMARHPNAFDRLYISMIEAGEAAGILDTVLDRVAIQIEKEMKIRRRVKGAMIYPLVVLTFAILTLSGCCSSSSRSSRTSSPTSAATCRR